MNAVQRDLVLRTVFQATKEDPSITADLIGAATEGVKEYAGRQGDKAGKLAFILIGLLEKNPKLSTPHWTNDQICDLVGPYFAGTPGWARIEERRKVRS